ncbi:hypothetical protein AAX29_01737 [Aliarcobacter thereius]|uniref:Uncharacterized protein n=1 Tax=Aliarcobacter thereius TaxID=544718 RepID=A0A1C0B5N9_9BACT|nr:hypothetical protein [Aliarcobacter thereius]OCL98218.1 hypothetical protein AAX29_01737 [Aliarcobacter thereius]
MKIKFLIYIKKLPIALNIAFVVSLISILAMDLYFRNIPEIFSWGSEFGDIYYRICLSIVASYIFYFIVVHLKAMKDKENVKNWKSITIKNFWSLRENYEHKSLHKKSLVKKQGF